MRIRIYINATKGSEEGHIDFSPSYRGHPSTARICCGGSFLTKTNELVQAAESLKLLDKFLGKESK